MNEKEYKIMFESLKKHEDVDQYLNEFVNLISKILYSRIIFVKNSDNDVLRNSFYRFLKDKIKEIYNSYKDSSSEIKKIFDDIEYIGCGHSSLAIRIGDKVIKVGKEKYDYALNREYNFDCLIPIFYYNSFKIADNEYYTLEVSPLIDNKNIKEEDVYNVYKNLRDLGYIWNDPKPENVGKIIKDISFKNHLYKKGDIVIIDLQDLAYVGEVTTDEILEEISMVGYNQKTYIYETRYMKEKGRSL